MIVRSTLKVLGSFVRLIKPHVNQYENVFQILQDKVDVIPFIEEYNRNIQTTTRDTPFQQELERDLAIDRQSAIEAKNTVLEYEAYSPVTFEKFIIREKVNTKPEILTTTTQIEGHYKPGNEYLKYHPSILSQVPIIPQYTPSSTRAYLFNLPSGVTQKQISNVIGYRLVKNVRIQYCLLGLPAFAVVDFNNESYLSEQNPREIQINGRICFLQSESEKYKFGIDRRQIVMKDIGTDVTPAGALVQLSKYGKIMHINVPMQIYKEQSLSEVKALFKNNPTQITLNNYLPNGTIESQLYPPIEQNPDHPDFYEQKQQIYKQNLKFSENVDVFSGKAGQITLKSKGYLVVTFSCQQEAQNCYYHLRNIRRVELLNGREEFIFDTKHYQALLRHIDNQLIHKGFNLEDPYRTLNGQVQQKTKFMLQTTFLQMTYNKMIDNYHRNGTKIIVEGDTKSPEFLLHHKYKMFLNQLKESIGKDHVDDDIDNKEGNSYGKSFDELAEEQLYGMRLQQRIKNPRYTVDVDGFISEIDKQSKYEKKLQEYRQQDNQERKKNLNRNKVVREDEQGDIDYLTTQGFESDFAQVEVVETVGEQVVEQSGAEVDELTSKGKSGFSTYKQKQNQYRNKTIEQRARSHVKYNSFVRDTINEYIGVFPLSKLEEQFYRKKPTFTNPHKIKFLDGQQFLKEEQMRNVLEFKNENNQLEYENYVKTNEIFKSLNLDVEELILKNFDTNAGFEQQFYTDVGVVQEEYEYNGEDIEKSVKELNNEAQFGEEYKIVTDQEGNKKIAKIAKIESIYPLELVAKCSSKAKQLEQELLGEGQQVLSEEMMKTFKKFKHRLVDGQQIPDEILEIFGGQKGDRFNLEETVEQFQQLGFSKKCTYLFQYRNLEDIKCIKLF